MQNVDVFGEDKGNIQLSLRWIPTFGQPLHSVPLATSFRTLLPTVGISTIILDINLDPEDI